MNETQSMNKGARTVARRPIRRIGKAISGLRSDPVLRSRIGSILHLMSGSFGVAAVMLGSIALAARALGPREFGAMALVLAIGRVCERLLRFESWQPLIRFVAAEEVSGDPTALSRLYAYGLLLDIASALLSALLAVGAGVLFGELIGLAPDQAKLVMIYAVAIACNIRGMPSAALRMEGKFRTLAYVQIVSGLVRLALSFVLLMAGAGLLEFIVLWAGSQILDAAIFNYVGFRTLRKSGIPNPITVSWRGLPQQFPGFLHFAFSTNLSSMLRTFTHEGDTLLVGMFAGPGAAGAYHLARRIAKVAQSSGELIQTVIYPDLARIWATTKGVGLGRMVKWLQLILAAIAIAILLAVWLVGEPALVFILGPGFGDAYPLLLTQLVAIALMLHASPSRSALLAMGRPSYVLGVAVAATAAFGITAALAMPQLGALGASVAHVVFGLLTAVLLDTAMWRQLRRVRRGVEQP